MTTSSKPPRKFGGQPGNRNALKHALYARLYSPETKDTLLGWDMKDFIAEAQLLRVSIEKVASVLLSEDVPLEQIAAMQNSLSNACKTITLLIQRYMLVNTGDDPIYLAWTDTTHEREFFSDGEPPE